MMAITYRIQSLKAYHDGFWDDIEDIPNLAKAVAKARELNEQYQGGIMAHRVIRVPGGEVMYKRGWVMEKDYP